MSGQTKSYCSHLDGYSVVTFPKELCKAPLDEIREAGEQVVSELTNQKAPQCLVDLTALDYMGSSMVASIVRIWKAIDANHGRMVVAVSSIGVREVLRVTGLSRVWTIKSSYDTALHELGFSSEAKIVKRELRLLAFVGPATLLVGGIAVALDRIPSLAALSQPPVWIAYSLITVAVVTSGISIFREHSWRRWLSVFVFLVAATLIGWLIWTDLPADFGWNLRQNGKGGSSVEQAEGEESDEASNNRMQDSGDKTTKEPYNTKQDGPPTASSAPPSEAAASKDDPVESKPTTESSPTNNASNQPASPPATSDASPGKKGLPATDSPPQPEGLKP